MFLKKLIFFGFLFIAFSRISFSQIPKFNPFFFQDSLSQSNVSTLQITAIGQYHYDKKWNAGNIYLESGDSLIAYYMRYDIMRNHLEVILDTKIMAINGSLIEAFEWFSAERLKQEKFVTCNSYDKNNGVNGFFEVLVKGEIQLLKHKRIIELREGTSPTLVNNTDSDVQAYETYFFTKGKKTYQIEGGKRRNLVFFNSDLLADYVADNRLRFSNENDLKKIVGYYNSLE